MQGTVVITLQGSASNQGIDEYELRRQFQHAGDIKSIRPVTNRPESVHYSLGITLSLIHQQPTLR
jgi:hypothetical protein